MEPFSIYTTKNAYDKAVSLLQKDSTEDDWKVKRLKHSHTIQDVIDAVEEARLKYDVRSKQSTARKWLTSFASRLTYYGKILDVLSQHHPEYVSLAWGTVKFAFVVCAFFCRVVMVIRLGELVYIGINEGARLTFSKLVLNHEEMVTELSRAMTNISDVLPCAELNLEMFRTDNSIETAVEELYAHIIEFLLRALKWYEQSPLKHALKAFSSPYKLRFDDLMIQIDRSSRKIDKRANKLAQVKILQMQDRVECALTTLQTTQSVIQDSAVSQNRLEALLMDIKCIIVENQAVSLTKFSSLSQSTQQIQIGMIVAATKKTPLATHIESLRYSQAVRRRRQIRDTLDYTRLAPTFEAWLWSPESTLVAVQGSAPTDSQTKDMATNLVDLLRDGNKPTAWALSGKNTGKPREEISIYVFKLLVCQVINMNNDRVVQRVSEGFNISRIEQASTESDWLQILQESMAGLPEVFIVIDMEIFGPQWQEGSCAMLFLQSLQALLETPGTTVKIAAFSFRRRFTSCLRSVSENASIVPLEQGRAGAARQNARGRGTSSRRSRKALTLRI